MDDFELNSKLRGYFKMPRNLVLDLVNNKISFNQFGLLIIYIAFADWDKRHKHYAITNISDNQLNKIKDLSKFKIKKNKLILFIKDYLELTMGKNKQMIVSIKNPDKFFQNITGKKTKNKSTVFKSKPT